MALNVLQAAQLPYPAAANSITVTCPGSAWGNSAYSEIVASVNASVLSGVVVSCEFGSGAQDWEIDIAKGAAASEVVIATIRGGVIVSTNLNNPCFRLPIGIDNIPNNSRLSCRIRCSTTDAVPAKVAVVLYDKPVANSWLTTAQPTVALPPATNSLVLVAGGGAWTSGAYQQLRTNSGPALIILATVNYYPPTGANDFELDLATGAAASEVVITTIPCHSNNINNSPGWSILANPLDNIAVNARVAMRIRATNASAQVRCAATAIEKPL